MNIIFVIVAVLVVIWLAGFLLKIGGKLIHLIILLALALFLLNLFGIL